MRILWNIKLEARHIHTIFKGETEMLFDRSLTENVNHPNLIYLQRGEVGGGDYANDLVFFH